MVEHGGGGTGPKSRQQVRAKLSQYRGMRIDDIVGEDGLIKPDCKQFAKDHAGAERAVVQPWKLIKKGKNKHIENDGE